MRVTVGVGNKGTSLAPTVPYNDIESFRYSVHNLIGWSVEIESYLDVEMTA